MLALALTWGLELATAKALLRRSWLSLAWPVLLVNAFSNPLANAAIHLGGWPVLGTEAAVVAAEIPLYALVLEIPRRQAAALSLAANVLSALAGGWLLDRITA